MITERQQEILGFIRSHISEKGYSPSSREVAARFNFTQPAAMSHLRALEHQGHIKRTPNVARSIVVL